MLKLLLLGEIKMKKLLLKVLSLCILLAILCSCTQKKDASGIIPETTTGTTSETEELAETTKVTQKESETTTVITEGTTVITTASKAAENVSSSATTKNQKASATTKPNEYSNSPIKGTVTLKETEYLPNTPVMNLYFDYADEFFYWCNNNYDIEYNNNGKWISTCKYTKTNLKDEYSAPLNYPQSVSVSGFDLSKKGEYRFVLTISDKDETYSETRYINFVVCDKTTIGEFKIFPRFAEIPANAGELPLFVNNYSNITVYAKQLNLISPNGSTINNLKLSESTMSEENGYCTIKLPQNLVLGKYKLSVTVTAKQEGVLDKTATTEFNVVKADPNQKESGVIVKTDKDKYSSSPDKIIVTVTNNLWTKDDITIYPNDFDISYDGISIDSAYTAAEKADVKLSYGQSTTFTLINSFNNMDEYFAKMLKENPDYSDYIKEYKNSDEYKKNTLSKSGKYSINIYYGMEFKRNMVMTQDADGVGECTIIVE